MLVAALLCLRCSGSFVYARWVSIFSVRVLYVCMCVHLGERGLVNRPAFLVSPILYSKFWNMGWI